MALTRDPAFHCAERLWVQINELAVDKFRSEGVCPLLETFLAKRFDSLLQGLSSGWNCSV